MPRRSADQGSKPFDFRAGMAGLPPLGGMFRAGDPAIVPPHKFHLLVNMRRTPGGLTTRPGLSLEFDTGVRECIDGLTEDAGEQGAGIFLYPGADAGSNTPGEVGNPATFRAIFPDASDSYSEFLFAAYGPAATDRGVNSPVLAFTIGTEYVGPIWSSRPFIFRGQVVQFAVVDRDGVSTPALLGINIPGRSLLQASDCWRNEDGPEGDPLCPGAAGQATPPGVTDPPLWPFQHPVGSVNVITFFDNPFSPGDFWFVYAANSDPAIFPPQPFLTVESIVTMQERIDDTLTGTAGVGEVLYFGAIKPSTFDYRIVRWDGAVQTNDYTPPPGMVVSFLSRTNQGPYLVQDDTSAKRLEDGSWAVGTGLGYSIGAGPDQYIIGGSIRKALMWGGIGVAVKDGAGGGSYNCPIAPDTAFTVHVHAQTSTGWSINRSDRVATLDDRCPAQGTFVFTTVDAVICGSRIYAIAGRSPVLGEQAYSLLIGDFNDPLVAVIDGGRKLSRLGFIASQVIWIQEVAGRVYVGGKFDGWNPITESAEPGIVHHGVYDVTDLPATITKSYRVDSTDQAFDDVAMRYSRGCIPVPSDDDGGEGFQAS